MLKKIRSLSPWGAHAKKKFSGSKKCSSLTMCKKCYTFYYKHSWHFYRPKQLDKSIDYFVSVHFTECPSCLEQDLAEENREDLYVPSESNQLSTV